MAMHLKIMAFLFRLSPIFRRLGQGSLCLTLAILLSTLMVTSPAWGDRLDDAIKGEVVHSPVEVYREILLHVYARDYGPVVRLLQKVKSWTDHLEEGSGIDAVEEIREAISQGHEVVLRSVLRLIHIDLLLRLEAGLNQVDVSLILAQAELREGYRNYLLLSPFIQDQHFEVDQKIKNLFRRGVTSKTDRKRLDRILNEMRGLILKGLPGLE